MNWMLHQQMRLVELLFSSGCSFEIVTVAQIRTITSQRWSLASATATAIATATATAIAATTTTPKPTATHCRACVSSQQ